jgi:zinc D-Ala-D-Ala carboxypeptidase
MLKRITQNPKTSVLAGILFMSAFLLIWFEKATLTEAAYFARDNRFTMGERLTANFTLAELTKTRHDLDNTPTPQVVQNLQLLAEKVLQPLRDAVGPVNVTSGYRSKLVNAAVNGAVRSDHLYGYAADLQSPDGNHRKLYDWLKANAMFTQLIYEFGNDTHSRSGSTSATTPKTLNVKYSAPAMWASALLIAACSPKITETVTIRETQTVHDTITLRDSVTLS